VAWAIDAGLEAISVISPIAAAKKNFLMNLSFLCLLGEHRKVRIPDQNHPQISQINPSN
jgi:hypothetical protein